MKKQILRNVSANTSRARTFVAMILAAFFLPIIPCHTVLAQDEVRDKSLKSYKMPGNLKKHLEEKYEGQIDEITSSVRATPSGPRGTLNLTGHIRPKNVEKTTGDRGAHARAMANAYLREEAQLLGISDLNEWREYKMTTDLGHDGEYAHLYYSRSINDLPFENAWIHITIGPDQSIITVTAVLSPAPSELYQAVVKKMVTEHEVREIIERDLKAHGFNLNGIKIVKSRKTALSKPPYVVWTAEVIRKDSAKFSKEPWSYEINAFTGEILRRVDMVIMD